MYESMRDTVSWQRSLGAEEIPGVKNLADAVDIPARKIESIKDLGGDVTSDVQFTVFPEHEVAPKDVIDGAEIVRVTATKDDGGSVLWRTCYGRS